MIGTILSGILGILFLTGAVMQYRCRGPVWSAEYLASSPKEKRRLRTRRAYYGSATACLLIGISLILLVLYNLTSIIGIMYAVWVCAGLFFLLLVYGSLVAAGRSQDRRQEAVMHRENLDDVFPHEIEEEIRNRRRAIRRISENPNKGGSRLEQNQVSRGKRRN